MSGFRFLSREARVSFSCRASAWPVPPTARCLMSSTSSIGPRQEHRYKSDRRGRIPRQPSTPSHRPPLLLRPFASTRPQSFQPRHFSTSSTHQHGHLSPPRAGEERKVTFIDREGQSHTFTVADGDNLLDIAQDNDLEMEGACGGSCACSTCHVIVADDAKYDAIPEPSDDENDMLDLAFGLTETSRLGCQVQMSPELDGLVVNLPSMTRNMQASDFEKK